MKNFSHLKQVKATPGQVENDRVDISVRRAVFFAAAFGIEPQQILFPRGYERPEHVIDTRVEKLLRLEEIHLEKQAAARAN